jgi:hypothetical protein
MKRNHLFASAAIGAVLTVTLPAQAQIRGGGVHGAVSAMQTSTFHGGLGPMHSAASNQADLSASGRAGARVDGLRRVDRTANAGAQAAAGDARRAKDNAAIAGRETVGAGETEASKASNAALVTTRAAASSTAAASVAAAGQGKTQVRNVDTVGAVAGGLSASAGKSVTTTKPEGASRPPHSSGTSGRGSPASKSEGANNGGDTPRGAGTHGGETDADASASVNASTH